MNSKFVEANRRIIARTVEAELKKELSELQAALDSADFERDFYYPDSALVKALTKFDTFFNRVVIKGWTKANSKLATPNAVEEMYTYLEAEAVAVPDEAVAQVAASTLLAAK